MGGGASTAVMDDEFIAEIEKLSEVEQIMLKYEYDDLMKTGMKGTQAREDLLAKHKASAPIRFVDFEKFKSKGKIPRYPDDADLTVNADQTDVLSSVYIYISHAWLTHADGRSGKGPHPDNVNNDKYKLLVNGINKCASYYDKEIVNSKVRNVYLWLDYSCLNQDKNPVEELSQLEKIMAYCDFVFVPVVDDHHDKWKLPKSVRDITQHYLAPSFSSDIPTSVFSRAWCRLEFMYAHFVGYEKLHYDQHRVALFTNSLNFAKKMGKRPIIVYGTKEDNVPNQNTSFSSLQLDGSGSPVHLSDDEEEVGEVITTFSNEVVSTKRRVLHHMPHIFLQLPGFFVNKYDPVLGKVWNDDDMRTIKKLKDKCKVYQNLNASTYLGDTNQWGEPHGSGLKTFPTGDTYTGEWSRGEYHGRGRFVSALGDSYDGDFKFGMFNGKGLLTFANGCRFEGEFADNEEVSGIFTYPDARQYKGEFRNSKFHGQGELTLPDGSTYVGSFRNGFKHGKGIRRFKNGDVYQGNYNNDTYNGKGRYTHAEGEYYEGDFLDGLKKGKGIFVYPDGEVYDGEWDDEQGGMHGKGSLKSTTGKVYTGSFAKDMKHGLGRQINPDGTILEGEFAENKLHGKGKMVKSDGTILQGQFVKGEYVENTAADQNQTAPV